jgi:hypothetical protein
MARIRTSFVVYLKYQHTLASTCCAKEYHHFTLSGRLLLLLLMALCASVLTVLFAHSISINLALTHLVRNLILLILLFQAAFLCCSCAFLMVSLLQIGLLSCGVAVLSFPLTLLLRRIWAFTSDCARVSGAFIAFVAFAAALYVVAVDANPPLSNSCSVASVPACHFFNSYWTDTAAIAGIVFGSAQVIEFCILLLIHICYRFCCPRLACCVVDQEIVNDSTDSGADSYVTPIKFYQAL